MASVFKGLNVKIDAVSVWIGGYIMRIRKRQILRLPLNLTPLL